MGDVVGREIIGRVTRHSRATERAAFGSRRRNRFGSVRFFVFCGASVFATDGRTDGARDRSKKGLRRESSINSFWGLSSRPIDSIRSDPIRPDRSFASGSVVASSNRDARGFRLIEVNKNLRDAVPSARSGVAGVVDVDVRASERSVARAIRFRSPTRSALARESSAGRRGRGRVARRFVRSPGSTASATVRSRRSFARRSLRSFARRHPSHPSIRREGRSASHGT